MQKRIFAELVDRPQLILPQKPSDYPIPSLPGALKELQLVLDCPLPKRKGRKSKGAVTRAYIQIHFLCHRSAPLTAPLAHSDVIVRSICPYCDQPLGPRRQEWFEGLPLTTLDTLPTLIGRLWEKTTDDPRHTNGAGRRVEITDFRFQVDVCDQHQYETIILPLACQYQWPRTIDFAEFMKRVGSTEIVNYAVQIYEDPWSGALVGDAIGANRSRSAKSNRDISLLFPRRRRKDFFASAG